MYELSNGNSTEDSKFMQNIFRVEKYSTSKRFKIFHKGLRETGNVIPKLHVGPLCIDIIYLQIKARYRFCGILNYYHLQI